MDNPIISTVIIQGEKKKKTAYHWTGGNSIMDGESAKKLLEIGIPNKCDRPEVFKKAVQETRDIYLVWIMQEGDGQGVKKTPIQFEEKNKMSNLKAFARKGERKRSDCFGRN